jgi:hypothetical protein
MDTPADPATPLKEVYQAFFDDLASGASEASVDLGWMPRPHGSETTNGQRREGCRWPFGRR